MARATAMTADARGRASIVAVIAAMALVVLDAGMVNVALPAIAASLRVTPAQAVLTVSAYQTALVIGLLPSAHVAEKLGYRTLFVAGLSVFGAASVMCGFAPSFGVLIVGRLLQGLGAAAIMALGIALLRLALGAERLGRAIGWNAMNVALCSAGGPIAGALVLSIFPWPWLFFVKLPIIVVALAASVALPEVRPSRRTIDYAGIGLHACVAGLFLVTAAMVETGWAILPGGLAVALALMLIRSERSREAPIWPIDLLARRGFRVAVAASVCCFIAQSSGVLALPIYLQLGLGHGPLGAAVVMTCWPLAVAMTSAVAGRLAERFGSAILCVLGGSMLGLGLALSALWPERESIVPLAIGAAASGLGFGLFQVPNNRTMFLSAPTERSAAAGGMQGSARVIGQTIGALAMGLLLAMANAAVASRLAFVVGAAFAMAAALISAMEVPARRIAPGSRSIAGL